MFPLHYCSIAHCQPCNVALRNLPRERGPKAQSPGQSGKFWAKQLFTKLFLFIKYGYVKGGIGKHVHGGK